MGDMNLRVVRIDQNVIDIGDNELPEDIMAKSSEIHGAQEKPYGITRHL